MVVYSNSVIQGPLKYYKGDLAESVQHLFPELHLDRRKFERHAGIFNFFSLSVLFSHSNHRGKSPRQTVLDDSIISEFIVNGSS